MLINSYYDYVIDGSRDIKAYGLERRVHVSYRHTLAQVGHCMLYVITERNPKNQLVKWCPYEYSPNTPNAHAHDHLPASRQQILLWVQMVRAPG